MTGRSSFNELESSSYRMHSSEFSSKGKLARVFPLQGEERRRERACWMKTFSGEKVEKVKYNLLQVMPAQGAQEVPELLLWSPESHQTWTSSDQQLTSGLFHFLSAKCKADAI